jgi:hypothetical protein
MRPVSSRARSSASGFEAARCVLPPEAPDHRPRRKLPRNAADPARGMRAGRPRIAPSSCGGRCRPRRMREHHRNRDVDRRVERPGELQPGLGVLRREVTDLVRRLPRVGPDRDRSAVRVELHVIRIGDELLQTMTAKIEIGHDRRRAEERRLDAALVGPVSRRGGENRVRRHHPADGRRSRDPASRIDVLALLERAHTGSTIRIVQGSISFTAPPLEAPRIGTRKPARGAGFRFRSGRLDLNQRPPTPQAGALPGCATPRERASVSSRSRVEKPPPTPR